DGLVIYTWSDGYTTPFMTKTSPGIYSVTITGTCGTKTPNPASFTALPQTNITSQPTSTTACIDSSATFTVIATGSGLNYQWSEGTSTPTLTTSVPGFYTVTVSGTCGTAVSNSVQLISTNTCTGTVTNLDNNTEIPTLQIFPNPTNGLIIISSPEPSDYKILDGIGSVVKNGLLNQGRNVINLELSRGIYYFNSSGTVKKLVLE
ncbi:MAG: T9SS type A sorting domain-containing protein, partial [Cytophagales bacterium]|nr:T9SS type A sorting domain-containing protein [Cytophagales bacterium]